MPGRLLSLSIVAFCLTAPLAADAAQAQQEGPPPAASEMMRLGLRGVYFVPNHGQWADEEVIYGFKSRGLDVAFRESTLTMHMRRELPKVSVEHEQLAEVADSVPSQVVLGPIRHPDLPDTDRARGRVASPENSVEWETLVLEVTFPCSNAVLPRGFEPQAARFNYFIGDDESKWASDVPSFALIVYENIYEGIDLHVMGDDGGVLKYEFHCQPGADHAQIRIRYDGIDALYVDERSGDLLIETPFGTLRDTAPVVWQDVADKRQHIAAEFEVVAECTYTISLLAAADPAHTLVLDPVMEWRADPPRVRVDAAERAARRTATEAVAVGEPRAVQYVEVPGRNLFSGQLIARPWQPEHWRAGGFNDAVAQQRIATARQMIVNNFNVIEWVWQTDEYIIALPPGLTENMVANRLLVTGNFQYVEPNWLLSSTQNCPNDPLFGDQWHHEKIESCRGWEVHTGEPTVTVGVCDSGIRVSHEDLLLHRREGYHAVWPNRRWEGGGGAIEDINGHGTAVTGCAAANADNGLGVAGMGWNLAHRMIRVTNDPDNYALISNVTHGARTSAEAGDKVVNVSYEGADSASARTTATYVKSVGSLLFWSAGNDGERLGAHERDADDLMVVGATDSQDGLAWFSNYGPYVDLVAPGVYVGTTSAAGDRRYTWENGTSFAAPLVCGLAALIWSADPVLTPDGVEGILKQSCDAIRDPDIFGYGRVNVARALDLLRIREPVWMTYFGGSGRDEGYGIATDRNDNALITGYTESSDFAGRNNSRHGFFGDVFALRVSASGHLQWMTYLGGTGGDVGSDIGVDEVGNAFITGNTWSEDFAGHNNAFHGTRDAFVLKLSPAGQLQWMQYFGGTNGDDGSGIAADGVGNTVITGVTESGDFVGRNNSGYGGPSDAFALRISPAGQLQWMTYLGGSGTDEGLGVALDSDGSAFVTGQTRSADFFGRNNAFHAETDAFVLELDLSGQLQWMTYLGGDGWYGGDYGRASSIDDAGDVFITGWTGSRNFEGRINENHGQVDAFLLKINGSGQIQWMAYLGGSEWDVAWDMVVDGRDVLVTGTTGSADFAGHSNLYHGGLGDAFALKVSTAGQVQWMTYLGGSGRESVFGGGIAVDGGGDVLVAGATDSYDFTGRSNAYYGSWDAFVLKLGAGGGAGSGPRLSIDATCPSGGPNRIEWSGATPGGQVALIFARNTGSFIIPNNYPCAGTQLGLGANQIQLAWQGGAGANGSRTLNTTAGPGACGGYIQLLDLTPCATSNVARIE